MEYRYMDEKITIIEGPPPTFEIVDEGWAFGLAETPILSEIAVTHLRTFNGPALVERCHRAWRNQKTINLEYRDSEGMEQRAPIVASRTVDTEGGQVLILWVRLARTDAEVEIEFTDGIEDDDDYDDDEYPDFDEFGDIDDFDDDDEDLFDEDDLYDNPDGGSLLPPKW